MLNKDFDQNYDIVMDKLFNDNYYKQEDDNP